MSDYVTAVEVVDWFSKYHCATPLMRKTLDKGCYVDTKCRKDLLLGVQGGSMIVGGRVRKFKFENLGGGVWYCTLEEQNG